MRRTMSLRLLALSVVLLVGATPLLAQQSTVTEDNLLRLLKSNAPEPLVIKAISMAKVIDVDTSLEGTVALMGKGVSQEVINALEKRKEQLQPSSPELSVSASLPAPTSSLTPASAEAPTASEVNVPDVGVYVETANGLVVLHTEATKTKSTSPFKLMYTGGGLIGGSKIQGVFEGPKSSTQLQGPKVVLIARLLEGENPNDCQLYTLDSKKNRREFTTGKMSFFKGMTTNPDAMTANFEKVGSNTYKAVLELSSGEYSFQTQGRNSYTFGVY